MARWVFDVEPPLPPSSVLDMGRKVKGGAAGHPIECLAADTLMNEYFVYLCDPSGGFLADKNGEFIIGKVKAAGRLLVTWENDKEPPPQPAIVETRFWGPKAKVLVVN